MFKGLFLLSGYLLLLIMQSDRQLELLRFILTRIARILISFKMNSCFGELGYTGSAYILRRIMSMSPDSGLVNVASTREVLFQTSYWDYKKKQQKNA